MAGSAARRGAWSCASPRRGDAGGCRASSRARGNCGSRSAALPEASQSPGSDSRTPWPMRCCHSSGVPSALRSRMPAPRAGLPALTARPPSRSHACQLAGSASLRLHTPISPRSGRASADRGASGACMPHARCSAFTQCWAAAGASLCTRRRGIVAALGCGVAGIGCGRHCTSRDSCTRAPSRPGRGSGTCTVNAVPVGSCASSSRSRLGSDALDAGGA